MLILPEEHVEEVRKSLKKVTKVHEVGRVEEGKGVKMLGEKEYDLVPLFRESPYTKVKEVIGEEEPEDVEEKIKLIEDAKLSAIEKKDRVIKFIRRF
jgi:hydrogenase expression/formation protein